MGEDEVPGREFWGRLSSGVVATADGFGPLGPVLGLAGLEPIDNLLLRLGLLLGVSRTNLVDAPLHYLSLGTALGLARGQLAGLEPIDNLLLHLGLLLGVARTKPVNAPFQSLSLATGFELLGC